MKKTFILSYFSFFISILSLPENLFSQNVGIGTTTPAEKLDVNGNINVTGTIKANGSDGTPNQVLMKNSSGNFAWGDISEFKNYITFTTVGSSTWTVPAGVTRILVEAWGGGGGSSGNGGGGGGGYVTAIFSVTSGSVSYTVGAAGAAGSPTATSGGFSLVAFSTQNVLAEGGTGDNSSTTFGVAPGGQFSGSVGLGFYGCVGEAGEQNRFEGYQFNSTTYRESQIGGKGGNGGNTINTGGKGGYRLIDPVTTTVIYGAFGGHGRLPGGGGGSPGGSGGTIKNGGPGMVIIHY